MSFLFKKPSNGEPEDNGATPEMGEMAAVPFWICKGPPTNGRSPFLGGGVLCGVGHPVVTTDPGRKREPVLVGCHLLAPTTQKGSTEQPSFRWSTFGSY